MCHFRVWDIALGSPSYWRIGGADLVRPGTFWVKLLALRHLSWLAERELGRLVAVANFITDRCPARPDPWESKETAASMVNPLPVADKVWSRLTPAMSRLERCTVATRAQAACWACSPHDWPSPPYLPQQVLRTSPEKKRQVPRQDDPVHGGTKRHLNWGHLNRGIPMGSMGSSVGWGQSTF